jgi:hypothetical protein
MNVLSSLSFGKVLKIALPGFVATLGLAVAVDAGLALVSGKPHPFLSWIQREPVLASFLAIPVVVLAGLTINALLFTYLLDRLVRRPYEAEHAEFMQTHREVFRKLVANALASAPVLPTEAKARFARHVDPGAFLLPTVDLPRFLYYQESYWSYLEFSLNMIVALTAAVSGLAFWALVNINGLGVPWWRVLIGLAVAAVVGFALSSLFLATARENYVRHRAKFLSLFVGAAYANAAAADETPNAERDEGIVARLEVADRDSLDESMFTVEND